MQNIRTSPPPIKRPRQAAASALVLDPKQVAEACKTLPPMPRLLCDLKEVLQAASTDVGHIAKLLRGDVALVAKILWMVNSPYYSLARPVMDLRRAIAYLGYNQIYRLALTMSVVSSVEGDEDSLQSYWRHSYLTALTAKHLARTYEPRIDTEEMWPAALLHDVGMLVYTRLFPEHYARIKEHKAAHLGTFVESEKALGLPSHTELGGIFCDQWSLPPAIGDAARYHHEDEAPPSDDVSDEMLAYRRMIRLSEHFAVLCNDTLRGEARDALMTTICEELDLDTDGFTDMARKVNDLQQEVSWFMEDAA